MDVDCIGKVCSVCVDLKGARNELVSLEYLMCRTVELTAELRNC